MKGLGKREIPEKTRLPTRKSGHRPRWEWNPVRPDTKFSHEGIGPDEAAGRWVFSGISRFPRPCTPAPLHTRLTSPSSALKTALSTTLHTSILLSTIIFTERGVSEEIWTALNSEVLKTDEGDFKCIWSDTGMKGAGETGDPRENPPTNESHFRKSGDPAGHARMDLYVGGAGSAGYGYVCCKSGAGGGGGCVRGEPRAPRQTEKLNCTRAKPGRIAKCKGGGKLEISKKTRQSAISPSTIPTCENLGVTPPRIQTRITVALAAASIRPLSNIREKFDKDCSR
ncbi:hypothetical protein PR048_014653 [Dryococelus australis]|uniref:Uncharacterized protein n=1 Tax=Dryococelus australis TaxID=614101 RepID=A0ABQ9HET8_9NEOP|nr:hypothetical protein PR048_014653 [Dryococelus australis]